MCCGCGVRSRSRCCLGAALARAARLRTSADDDHRPARHLALVSLPVCAVRPARLAPVPSVPPAQIASLFAGAADAEARYCSRISRAARRAPPHDDADAVLGRHHLFPRARGAARQVQLNSSRRLVGDRDADHLRLGKVFGSIVMLLALGMFALPIAILSADFSQESARREFVVTWSMVARVPLFSTLDAAEVAEVTKLLYTRLFQPGATIVPAGDAGGAMYFMGSGDATVCVVPGKPIRLHEGDFFGEMALLEHRSHRHTVVAYTVCRVYVLDSEGLARLGRRHPEIVRYIKEVAKEGALENQKLRRAPRTARAKSAAPKTATEAQ